MVKTLKDCAFPLPMSALGGSAQTFESFEGALLDVVAFYSALYLRRVVELRLKYIFTAILECATKLRRNYRQHAQTAGPRH